MAAGATEVVPEVLEGSLMLATHSLLVLGVPLNRVLKRIRTIREERYSLFRGFFHGATDAADAAENLQPRLHTVVLSERAFAAGRTLRELDLAGLVEITGVRRRGAAVGAAGPRLALRGRRRGGAAGRPEDLRSPRASCWAGDAPCRRPAHGRGHPGSKLTDRGSLKRQGRPDTIPGSP